MKTFHILQYKQQIFEIHKSNSSLKNEVQALQQKEVQMKVLHKQQIAILMEKIKFRSNQCNNLYKTRVFVAQHPKHNHQTNVVLHSRIQSDTSNLKNVEENVKQVNPKQNTCKDKQHTPRRLKKREPESFRPVFKKLPAISSP